jgi:hypothetical protein
MKNLLISGETLQEWNLSEVFETELDPKERILQYENDNTIGKYCGGMTYLELQQLDYELYNF